MTATDSAVSPGAGRVVMIAGFPPPVGGAAKNSEIIATELAERGMAVTRLSISVGLLSHKRTLAYHLKRLWTNAKVVARLLLLGGPKTSLYIVPGGGLGLIYSFVQAMAGLFLYPTIVVHHRSCAYIESPTPLMRLLCAAGRKRFVHVFLSPSMAADFQSAYGPVRSAIATNARFVRRDLASASASASATVGQAGRAVSREPERLRIGHLSNLCREKGFFLAAEAFERLVKTGVDAELHLGGPVADPEVDAPLSELIARHPDRVFTYGPLFGQQKAEFYRGLDVFLFPTLFRQEAQPNVVYEALAAGVPVLATPRGCIPDMLSGARGATSRGEADFVEFALGRLSEMSRSLKELPHRRRAILGGLEHECVESERQYEALYRMFGGPAPQSLNPI